MGFGLTFLLLMKVASESTDLKSSSLLEVMSLYTVIVISILWPLIVLAFSIGATLDVTKKQ